MPVTCPICGGGHPKWDCKRQDLVRVPLPPVPATVKDYMEAVKDLPTPAKKTAVRPRSLDLANAEFKEDRPDYIPQGVVIPKNGIPRWVNDWPEGNFAEKIKKGYRVVEKDGKHVTRPSGEGRLQYLMVAPERLAAPPPAPDKKDKKISLPSNIIEGTAQEVENSITTTRTPEELAEALGLPPAETVAKWKARLDGQKAYMREYMKKYRAKKKIDKGNLPS